MLFILLMVIRVLLCVAMASMCMLIVTSGGAEQRRRGDNNVKCPVCMASWDHMTSLPSMMRPLDDHASSTPSVTPTKLQLVCLFNMYDGYVFISVTQIHVNIRVSLLVRV